MKKSLFSIIIIYLIFVYNISVKYKILKEKVFRIRFVTIWEKVTVKSEKIRVFFLYSRIFLHQTTTISQGKLIFQFPGSQQMTTMRNHHKTKYYLYLYYLIIMRCRLLVACIVFCFSSLTINSTNN